MHCSAAASDKHIAQIYNAIKQWLRKFPSKQKTPLADGIIYAKKPFLRRTKSHLNFCFS